MVKYSAMIIFTAIILVSGCTIRGSEETAACEDSVYYTDWSGCINDSQQRVKAVFSCINDSMISEEVEFQECITPCYSNWTCTNWTECSKEKIQFRECNDLSNCINATNISATNQSCIFNNPCSAISDSRLKEECDSLVYINSRYCFNITNSADSEACLFSYAYTYSDFNACDLINSSSSRNTCKAVVTLSSSYCNVLPPENRSSCTYELDLRYLYLATVRSEPTLCNNIQNTNAKSSCITASKPYESYRDSMSKCIGLSFENSSIYQTSRACYIYHIKKADNSSICSSVASFIRDDCIALFAYNLTHCYDQTGYSRDFCLANFAYFYDDMSACRDASSENNCKYAVGYWHKSREYCEAITDKPLKDVCISSYRSYCEENVNNCPSFDYCSLISDAGSKNTCILKRVKNEIKYNEKVW